MKKVLITGANSYIGVSFENYVREHYASELSIDTIDMIDNSWRKKNYSLYDIVYHVAGIAHAEVGNVSDKIKAKYYAINTDLAIESAKKAKEQGVRQFVFMSSAIIYGDSAPYGKNMRITKDTEPRPANFYGDSKWQADKGLRELADEKFTVTVLRPPMIYGKGSKGNYLILTKIAKKLPIFPDVKNERSMLYIENLCEFLCQVMIRGDGGVFWPQNAEYSRTSEIVKMIAEISGHRILVSNAWNWSVVLTSRIPGKIGDLVNKAFGNLSYDQKMSEYDFEYQKISLQESIRLTEKEEGEKEIIDKQLLSKEKMKRKTIWIVDHYSSEPKYGGISRQYDFAKELDKRGYNVIIFASGFSHYTHTYISEEPMFISKAFKHVRYVYVKTHSYGENNGKDRALNMFSFMRQVLRFVPRVAKKYGNPDVVEGASVHPLAWIVAYKIARKYKIRFVAEVRDFWPQIWIDSGEKKSADPMCLFFRAIERFIYARADHIIYSLYHGDRYLCDERGIPKNKVTLIGQPMDCERYDENRNRFEELPDIIKQFVSEGFICVFTGYYMEYDGVNVMLEAEKILQENGLPIKMVFVGSGEEKEGMVRYVNDNKLKNVLIADRINKDLVPALLSHSDICIAHCEFRGKEKVFRYGISKNKINDYLYSGACILFGFRYDDNEVVESKAGLQFEPYNPVDLAEKIIKIYKMSPEQRMKFGENGKMQTKKNHDVETLTDKLITSLFISK